MLKSFVHVLLVRDNKPRMTMHDHELANISFMGCLWLKTNGWDTHTHLNFFHPRTLHFLFVLLVGCDPALLEVKEQTTKKVGEKKLHQAGLWHICSNQVHGPYSSIPLFLALEICRCMGSNGCRPSAWEFSRSAARSSSRTTANESRHWKHQRLMVNSHGWDCHRVPTLSQSMYDGRCLIVMVCFVGYCGLYWWCMTVYSLYIYNYIYTHTHTH